MKTIRINTFETNSSSCHALTHIKEDDWNKFTKHPNEYALHIPDCETVDSEPLEVEYELLTIKEAWNLYNHLIDKYNEDWAKWVEQENKEYPGNDWVSSIPDKVYEKISSEKDFYKLLNKEYGCGPFLENDDTIGHFFNFKQVSSNMSGLDFEYEWMNNYYGKTRFDIERK